VVDKEAKKPASVCLEEVEVGTCAKDAAVETVEVVEMTGGQVVL
jgi:hypothetical protein